MTMELRPMRQGDAFKLIATQALLGWIQRGFVGQDGFRVKANSHCLGRYPRNDGVGRDVLGDHTSSAYNAPSAKPDPLQDSRTRPDPHIIFYYHRLVIFGALFCDVVHELSDERCVVIAPDDGDIGSEHHLAADDDVTLRGYEGSPRTDRDIIADLDGPVGEHTIWVKQEAVASASKSWAKEDHPEPPPDAPDLQGCIGYRTHDHAGTLAGVSPGQESKGVKQILIFIR